MQNKISSLWRVDSGMDFPPLHKRKKMKLLKPKNGLDEASPWASTSTHKDWMCKWNQNKWKELALPFYIRKRWIPYFLITSLAH